MNHVSVEASKRSDEIQGTDRGSWDKREVATEMARNWAAVKRGQPTLDTAPVLVMNVNHIRSKVSSRLALSKVPPRPHALGIRKIEAEHYPTDGLRFRRRTVTEERAGMCQIWMPPDATGMTAGNETHSWVKNTPRERSCSTHSSRIRSRHRREGCRRWERGPEVIGRTCLRLGT